MRTHCETLMGDLYHQNILLAEASVFAKHFDMPGKAMQTIHQEIGITADAVPERPVTLPSEGDMDELTPVNWVVKHKDLREVFERGDGLFIVNPETQTRVIIKQEIDGDKKFMNPGARDVGHVPRETVYDIWVFNNIGELLYTINRPMTGKREIVRKAVDGKLADGKLTTLSEVKDGVFVPIETVLDRKTGKYSPDAKVWTMDEIKAAINAGENIAVERFIKKADSNIYVRYIDRSDAQAFEIPNGAFRQIPHPNKLAGAVGVNVANHTVPDFKSVGKTSLNSDQAVNKVVEKYGRAIKNKISRALGPLKEGILEYLSDAEIGDELVVNLVKDYRKYLRLEKDISQIDLESEFTAFLKDARRAGKYGLSDVNTNDSMTFPKLVPVFKTQEDFDIFIRDFALSYIKSISTFHTQRAIIDTMDEIF